MTDKTDTREIVLDILLAVTRDGEYSHIALKNTLDKYRYLEKRERAFLTKVVEGTLEYQIRIDYIINTFSNTKVHKMKPIIRCILRSAVYQICFLDGVPDSAACNEAVKLAKKRGFHTLKGFVNGVLRNIARNKENITYPEKEKEPVAFIYVIYYRPEWLVRQWKNGVYRIDGGGIFDRAADHGADQYRTHHETRIDRPAAKRRCQGIGICADGGCLIPVRL